MIVACLKHVKNALIAVYTKSTVLILCGFFVVLCFPNPVVAKPLYGVHLFSPSEVQSAHEYIEHYAPDNQVSTVVVPFLASDLTSAEKKQSWVVFFESCKRLNILPIIRLATELDSTGWRVPTHRDIIESATFLASMEWPDESRKYVIVFNEPNHANEWGGTLNPEQYAHLAVFASQWFRDEDVGFILMPAGLDLAAPNGTRTMEAFTFWDRALEAEPELFSLFGAWSSHSYPNPAFSGSAFDTKQNSIRGFAHERAYLEKKTGRVLPIFITETGWANTPKNLRTLRKNIEYAVNTVWDTDEIVSIAPFVLRGDPGPFAEFGLVRDGGKLSETGKIWVETLSKMK
ncbi:MAG: hypothetical protein UX04_C0006G0006 [Microgenomates group bacterium GW2011_GWF2_45_18]|nr:MAG: hypothetical protein UW18_C0006G0006 [Microgenomates group bacterium GW2011_GWF1_44_10]KKU01471.1 MAG: hypothetical protein UX04_C0006G0006 [Microgenomates group bacterium GW2011_GWF2_45_18]